VTSLTNLIHLDSQDGERLHIESNKNQVIEIRQMNNLRWMHFGSDAIQSVVDIEEPSKPQQDYISAMIAGLIFPQRPNKSLNLGVGGGTIERFFIEHFADRLLTSVEANKSVIQLAHRFFFVPDQYPIINDTAENFIRRDNATYQIIFCDISAAQHHAQCLFDHQFYRRLFQRLSADGILVINLLPDSEQALLDILQAIRRYFDWGFILEFPNHRNILLYCLKQKPPASNELESRSLALSKRTKLDLNEITTRLIRLPDKP
jgi:spermidine synthase